MSTDTKTRDSLARDRTHLANERTLLSYVRTALALVLAGGFILKFETDMYSVGFAIILILFGLVIAAIGISRYISYRSHINEVK